MEQEKNKHAWNHHHLGHGVFGVQRMTTDMLIDIRFGGFIFAIPCADAHCAV